MSLSVAVNPALEWVRSFLPPLAILAMNCPEQNLELSLERVIPAEDFMQPHAMKDL